jgi:hypothetical protein
MLLRGVKLSSDLRSNTSSILFDDLESFLPSFFYATCRWTAPTITTFNRSFTTFEYRSQLKSLWPSVELPPKTVFAIRCNFTDSEANLNTSVLFLSRKSQIAHNTHNDKRPLRRIALFLTFKAY